MDSLDLDLNAKKTHKGSSLNFMLLVIGRIVSGMGNSIFGFAIGLYILDLTGSATAFSITLSVSIIPGVIVNILAGAYVDKHNKKKIIVTTDILSGITVLMFLMVFALNSKSVVLIMIYTFIIGIIQALFSLAINSSIPDFVSKDNVSRANSTFQAINASISIIGPITGALAYKLLGIKIVILLNGVGFIIAGIAETFLIYEFNRLSTGTGGVKSYIEDIKVSLSYLNQNKILKFFFILAAVLNFIYNPLLFIVIPFINYNIIKIDGLQLSLIQSSAAIGIIISAVIIMLNKEASRKLLSRFFTLFMLQALLVLAWGFPEIPFFQGVSKWGITITFCLILILYGAMNTAQNIPVVTYFQLKIPDEIRARVIGVFSSALYITTPLGMWVYGILLERVKWTYITFFSGLLMLGISIIASRNIYYRTFLDQQKESKGEVDIEVKI
ncbi:MAG: MFS transporter [Clostridia bacterium]|nr:MFS transporter [Clostridia bacterium]